MCLWVQKLISEHQPDKLVIEDVQYQNNQLTFQVLAQLQGGLLEIAYQQKLPCDIVSPNTWRKTCNFLHGNEKTRAAQKKVAKEWVQSIFNIKCTQDEADAICIGYAASKIAEEELNWE